MGLPNFYQVDHNTVVNLDDVRYAVSVGTQTRPDSFSVTLILGIMQTASTINGQSVNGSSSGMFQGGNLILGISGNSTETYTHTTINVSGEYAMRLWRVLCRLSSILDEQVSFSPSS